MPLCMGCCAGHEFLAKAGGVETQQLHEGLDAKWELHAVPPRLNQYKEHAQKQSSNYFFEHVNVFAQGMQALLLQKEQIQNMSSNIL